MTSNRPLAFERFAFVLCGLALLGASACSSGGGGATGAGGSTGTGGATGGGSGGDAQGGNGGTPAGGTGGTATGGTGGGGTTGTGGVGTCNTSPGKALQFNGNMIDLMTGDLGTDLPGGDVPRTIEVWAKYIGAASWTAEHSLLETSRAMGVQNRVLGLDNSGYTAATMIAQFGPYTNGYSDNNNPNGVFVPNIPESGWIHLSWSYAGNHGALSFTVNGTEYTVRTQAGTPTLAFNTGVVTLGASQDFGTAGWTGVLDEVRIWSIARTPAEITRDMKVVLNGMEPGLVAYYRLDEGAGTFTDDVRAIATHRLSFCTAAAQPRCVAMNNATPTWVDSDIPGPFTCAP